MAASGSSVHVCSFDGCSAVYKKLSKLREHIRSHTGERPFACSEPGCEKTFIRKSHLARHGLSHSGVKQVSCTWAGCSDQFVSTTNLKKHIARIHEGKPYKCTYGECTKGFQKHRQLRIHEYEHTGVLPFPCEKCNKRFLLPSKLNRHLKVHEGYNCRLQDCGATFDKWSVLQAHMKERHPHNTSHKCEVCGKEFSMQCRLTQHAQIHSPSRDVFPCPFNNCKRSYTKMSNLKTHIQSYHESRRPFSCTQQDCNKTFAHEISLRRHVKAVHDAKTSLPPRKPRKVGKRKSNFASRLTGYKEKKTPAENTTSEEEDSINPALLLPEEEHTTSGTNAPCGELCELQADTRPEEDSSTDSTTDRIAESSQILTEDTAEGSLVIGTLQTIDYVEEGDRITESPKKPAREEDIAEDSLVIGTLETIDYVEEDDCTDVGSSEAKEDPATFNMSSCAETTEVKESEGKGESSEEVQLRVMA